MRKLKSIEKKLLLRLIFFTVLLATAFCLLVSAVYYHTTSSHYTYLGNALTTALANMIDGDRAIGYLATREKDEAYQETYERILNLYSSFDVYALYVLVPYPDRIEYIWTEDTMNPDETLGYTEAVTPEEHVWLMDRLHGRDHTSLRYFDDPYYGRIVSAATPILNSEGEPVALAMTDFSVNEIGSTILRIILSCVVVIAVLTIGYILLFYSDVRRNMTRPILKLTAAASEMRDTLEAGEAYHSDIRTGDELEILSKSFEKMDEDLRRYLKDNLRITAERERFNAELNLAASIQIDQLPRNFPAFPGRTDFDIYATMTPAKTVGGDFYDFFLINETTLGLAIADVSGKGIPAALFMMVSRVLIRNCLLAGNSPGKALSIVNAELSENNETGQFVTVWLAVIDLKTGRGLAANAGHEHPALRRAGGSYELVKYKHSLSVAAMEQTRFAEHDFQLFPGDSLFVYTDGVAEATDLQDQLYGADRMLSALNRDPDAGPKETVENVLSDIQEFVGKAEQFDDITMLCLRYFG